MPSTRTTASAARISKTLSVADCSDRPRWKRAPLAATSATQTVTKIQARPQSYTANSYMAIRYIVNMIRKLEKIWNKVRL